MTSPPFLLPSQSNELFKMIQGASDKLTPAMFEWTRDSPHGMAPIYRLHHRDSSYYFRISYQGKAFDVQYSPGESLKRDGVKRVGWDAVRKYFSAWLHHLNREVGQPDLWASAQELPRPNLDIDREERFSDDELRQVDESIDQVITAIQQPEQFQSLGPQDRAFLVSQFDGLKALARSSTKHSWGQLLVGVSVTVVIALGGSPSLASALFTVVKDAFSWATTTGIPLLLP